MNYQVLIFCVLMAVSGCISEDFFGYSPYAEIKSIQVSNQASQSVIDSEQKTVYIEMPPGISLENIAIQSLTLSSFATSDLKVGDRINLTSDVALQITAEDGSVTSWTLHATIASVTPQLQNSDFNSWYQTNGGYFEPGTDATTTIWGTGNPGTRLLGLYPTTPLELATDNDLAARMETLDNGRVPASLGFPISAGSIFVGRFNEDNLDPTDPRAAIEFGSPFSGRPLKFRIDYSYVPGPENRDKSGNLLPYKDQCDIYAYLEVRTGNEIQRLATAWFRSDTTTPDLSSIEVDFTYGELDDSFPVFMRPADGKYVTADSAGFILPTHMTFVASSSYDGDNFAGAVGSTLVVDNLELIYSE